ncbi:phosphoenolpyruvate mutase [Oceanobacillus chungangensis]|uniref:phosphoenolpyruvate mutase n=1 Tax=Oceanobacillus chungangensis TaxID=1229152 RepID=A0A3D8PY76_9BACI|nr:phosphoenolpyruvate mutase [Oceanobacillus chungangensis]RDW20732.1 phosphoenolpyruvate mutase [Oceanobacillus chungangensis]
MKKSTQLKNLIRSNQLETIMEAHNALSAKIVEETGFKGIWASGLSISAALGVRDNNEASWTQILEVLEFMSDATTIPILLDGDTGYGNFNNARRLVQKLEQRDIAGVCIEDKLFPKTNSFIRGEVQQLADIEEFSGKIKAMKDVQKDDDFVVVSRVEALIAGWGVKEALKRAEAYRQAGADAILIHSKQSDSNEIEAFMKEWGNRHPVVIVPTKYYKTPTSLFQELGVSLVIWANHNLRASIKAMKETSGKIYQDQSLLHVEQTVSPLEEVFHLQNEEELGHAETLYLPQSSNKNGTILVRKPEALAIQAEQLEQLKANGVNNIVTIPVQESITGELVSLYQHRDKLGGDTIISYNDIFYKPYILKELLQDKNDITIVVDADGRGANGNPVITSEAHSKLLFNKTVNLQSMTTIGNQANVHGEFIGLWKVSEKGAAIINKALEDLMNSDRKSELTLADLLNRTLALHPVAVHYIKSSWLDRETYEKVQEAGDN